MKLELFTVYLGENGAVEVEVNEEVVKAYKMTLDDFEENFNTDNLMQGIQDFVDSLNS